MAYLREEEIRRLVNYLRQRASDAEELLRVEDEIRSEDATDFLREPEILAYFPSLKNEFFAGDLYWQLQIIPHAHLRMVQRGIGALEIVLLFQRFVQFCRQRNEIIVVGAYQIVGKSRLSSKILTLRTDVDLIDDAAGKAHVVTTFAGRAGDTEANEIELE